MVRWTIVVRNCGRRAATGVSVTDRLRTGATVRTRGSGTLVGERLRWKTGTLAPGARKIYRFTTRISAKTSTGRYVNRATADGDNAPPASGQGSITVTA